MDIYYKILEIHPSTLTYVVRYWTDELTEESLAVDRNRKIDGTPLRCKTDVSHDIPIPIPTAEELDLDAKYKAPWQWLKKEAEKVSYANTPTNVEHLNALIDQTKQTRPSEILEYQDRKMKEANSSMINRIKAELVEQIEGLSNTIETSGQ